MFSKHHDHRVYADLSTDLREEHHWQVGSLRSFEYLLDVVAMAVEPMSGLLAIGMGTGAIHIFGAPGVESTLIPPKPIRVKFLHFAPSVYRLVCVDDNNQLHIWDLLAAIRPKHLVSASWHQPVNCLTVSPSHTHAFVVLQSGEIETYDLLCLRKSPYTIPNMWTLYEGKAAVSGVVQGLMKCSIPIDFVIHPRDLNLAFVAYGGGVILSDLTQRSAIRAFELSLPPGAPGGVGCSSNDFLTLRHLSVTALAIHPTGHLFAVGYADGSIAFWAVEDEDRPLLVRTIDKEDVNIIDECKLEECLKSAKEEQAAFSSVSGREPIFKLSWSGFPKSSDTLDGATALTILGGLSTDHATGLTVHWFSSADPALAASIAGSDSSGRESVRKSLVPFHTFFIPSPGAIQDFLLIPRSSPHFLGSFDPVAILSLCDYDEGTRSTEAYLFPSPTSARSSVPSRPLANASINISPSSLRSLNSPPRLVLPSSLRNGDDGVIGVQLMSLDHNTYDQLVGQSEHDGEKVPLKGGLAWTDDWPISEKNFAKYQTPRLLVTTHRDLTVQFQDISVQLLINPDQSAINAFPRPLRDLTIDVASTLLDPLVLNRTSPTILRKACIDSVHLTPESLECAVVLQSGEVVIYRLASDPRDNVPYKVASDKELIILEHIPLCSGHRFYPFLMLVPGKGRMTAFAFSSIGFLAASHGDGSLLVVDLRGPRILLRADPAPEKKRKEALRLHSKHHPELDSIGSLAWTVNPHSSDSRSRILLIAVRASGLTEIFTISKPPGSDLWAVEGECMKIHTVHDPLGIFVLDSATGAKRRADGSRLRLSLESSPTIPEPDGILIVAGTKGAKCVVNLSEDQLGKINWSNKAGAVRGVEVIEKMGSRTLVAFTDQHKALVYSLPHLTLLHTFQLPALSEEPLAVDETGDLVGWLRHSASGIVKQLSYTSLFSSRRKYPMPNIDFKSTRVSVPPQPQPITVSPKSVLSSWLTFGQSMTGEQLDLLLAGPDRPLPHERAQDAETRSSAIQNTATEAVAGLYGRLSSALSERGQMLEGLGERFNSLEEGSRDMVSQAKRLAMEQQAKGWFGL